MAETLAWRKIPFGFASGAAHDPVAREWFDRPFIIKPYTIQDIAHLLAKVLAESFNPLPESVAAEIAQVPVLLHPTLHRSSESPAQ